MRYIKIYLTCLHTAFSRAAAYRADFILGNFITLLSNIIFPLVTVLIYANGAEFPRWDMWEVLLIQSVFSMSSGASAMFCGGILWTTMDHIQSGSFETVLLKPLPPLFFIAAANFDTGSIGLFFGGLVMTVISALKTGMCKAENIPLFLLLFASGAAVMCGLDLIMAAISFKWVGNSCIPEIFDSIKEFGKYPLEIFPRGIQALSAIIIPVACVGFFPASALLGRLDTRAFISVLPCLLFFLFGIWLYDRMIKLYEGVGG
ncbi:MAG: ABC-2 family transporter protein [Oscillospiraceae bacterium]|nr:ABC-2 family transporter protein [Oscillospiraceae bacterium]